MRGFNLSAPSSDKAGPITDPNRHSRPLIRPALAMMPGPFNAHSIATGERLSPIRFSLTGAALYLGAPGGEVRAPRRQAKNALHYHI